MSGKNPLRKQELLVQDLASQDCTVKRTKKGWFIGFPDGSSMALHTTDSDHRALKNTRARIRRAGLDSKFI